MGRRVRAMKEELDWRGKYGKEATGIIIDLVGEYKKHSPVLMHPQLVHRIARLEAASAVWDAIKKNRKDVN